MNRAENAEATARGYAEAAAGCVEHRGDLFDVEQRAIVWALLAIEARLEALQFEVAMHS